MAARRKSGKGRDDGQLGFEALWGGVPAVPLAESTASAAPEPEVPECDVEDGGAQFAPRSAQTITQDSSPDGDADTTVAASPPSREHAADALVAEARDAASDAPPASAPLAPVIDLASRRRSATVAAVPPPSAPRASPVRPPRTTRASDEVPLPRGLRLEKNLALLAGAGAGKTYSLVTMCLHLLGGARADREPIAPSDLGLMTFTEKAAAEMRGRLRERLEALADGRDAEVELRESYAAIGRPMPERKFWRTLLDELGGATIGTFHSLCTQLLRRAPQGSGVNPDFELLEERDSRRLIRQTIERVLLRRVQANDRHVRHLVSELGFSGGARSSGLVDALVPVYTRIRVEGLSAQYVQVGDAASLRRQFDAALAHLRARTVQAFVGLIKHKDRLERFQRILQDTTFETIPEQLPRLRAELASTRSEPFTSLKPFVKKFDRKDGDDGTSNLGLLHGACVMAPHEEAVREVLTEVADLHRRQLDELRALDFTGLLVGARDLLRDYPQARRDAQARFEALLVDEFQDTNRLQLEIVLLLAERRAGAPRPISTAFESQHLEIIQLPLEPAFLAVVGDRKQAIYEFRGADVSVFELMATCIERHGGGRAYLRSSRRSTPRLVQTLNRVMARVLGSDKYRSPPRDFEVVFVPEHDDLVPVRTKQVDAPPLVRLTRADEGPLSADAFREADADAVARWVAQLVQQRTWPVISRREADPPRPVRGGDVAMLFQRFTQLEAYRQALVRHGVRHRVIRGRGFFGAQEVVDVACLLALLAQPDDALSFAAVLRSPFVGLSDSALVELASPGGRWPRGLRPRDVLVEGRRPTLLDAVEAVRLERFVATWHSLEHEHDRLGLRSLLRVIIDGSGYRVSVAASPFGEQALANLDKLLELATSRERSGESVAAFARELLELADSEPSEAQGEVVDELDSDAITLCTVHQAKGLEWPIVVLPDLTAAGRDQGTAVRFDRVAGLGLKPPSSDEGEMQSLSVERIAEIRHARTTAERLRLLYVAMTRARDRVVLGLLPGAPRQGSWAADLAPVLAWADVREQTEEVDVASLPDGVLPRDQVLALPEALAATRDTLARVRHAPAATARTAVLPVTALQDFVGCPRRYHYAHQVGLSERPHLDVWRDDGEATDVRERGTAAHRLIELTPLDAVKDSLSTTLLSLRRAEGLDDVAGPDVLEWVTRFWRSRFGSALPALGEASVHRELPFVLGLHGDDGFQLLLRGQIDLLVEGEGELLVVDYKTAVQPAAGLEPYRFQLGCYALAARRFAGRDVRVRSGISFLRETDVEPRWLDTLPDDVTLERELVAHARELTRSQVAQVWAGRERPRCDALHCGFVYRCHR